jgi:hypothetical protein
MEHLEFSVAPSFSGRSACADSSGSNSLTSENTGRRAAMPNTAPFRQAHEMTPMLYKPARFPAAPTI